MKLDNTMSWRPCHSERRQRSQTEHRASRRNPGDVHDVLDLLTPRFFARRHRR